MEVPLTVLLSWLCHASGSGRPSEAPLPAARPCHCLPGPETTAVTCRCWPGALGPVNFRWAAVLPRLYLPLVGVTDFATLGSRVILPVFCVLNVIVALLFSLKKISKNC